MDITLTIEIYIDLFYAMDDLYFYYRDGMYFAKRGTAYDYELFTVAYWNGWYSIMDGTVKMIYRDILGEFKVIINKDHQGYRMGYLEVTLTISTNKMLYNYEINGNLFK